MSGVDIGQDLGKNFPVSETIRSDILDARTISRSGQWWTAILLFNNPKNNSPYITKFSMSSKDSRAEWLVSLSNIIYA